MIFLPRFLCSSWHTAATRNTSSYIYNSGSPDRMPTGLHESVVDHSHAVSDSPFFRAAQSSQLCFSGVDWVQAPGQRRGHLSAARSRHGTPFQYGVLAIAQLADTMDDPRIVHFTCVITNIERRLQRKFKCDNIFKSTLE